MTPKESKRCCKRFYIYFVIVLATGLWIWAINEYTNDVGDAIELTILCPALIVFVILDIYYIKCKDMKYACASFWEDEDDRYKAQAHADEVHYMQQEMPAQALYMNNGQQ